MDFLNRSTFLTFKRSFLRFFSSKKVLFIISLVIFSISINIVFIFHPIKGKRWFSLIYKKPLHQTLQKVDGPLIGNQLDIRVLKVKHGNNIYLEFLSKQADDSYIEINSVKLKGNRDGYFEYWGEMVSLLLLDDDGDGKLDVIAPTFDKFFRPQINLVSYNEKTKLFELKSNWAYPKVIPSDFRIH